MYRAIDLFAGAGGFSLAARNCGIDVIAAIELDTEACTTYRQNLAPTDESGFRPINDNILEIDPHLLMEKLGLQAGELDLLIGGPPCQGFSSHRIKGKGINDPRNGLLLRYFDFVKALQPKTFLVENVPGLLWQQHAAYLEKFQELAKANNYHVFPPEKLNAKNFGVPQNRERVFLLGIRKDQNYDSTQWPPQQTHFAPGADGPAWLNAATVFEVPPDHIQKQLERIEATQHLAKGDFLTSSPVRPDDPCHIHMKHTPALIERFRDTPINEGREASGFRLPCHSNGHSGHKDVYGRIRLAQPGPTITTGCFNPSKGRFLHPWEDHGITIRQAARFQTFPEDFDFAGGITSQGTQVGNAVPVKLGEAVIRAALKCIESKQQS